MLIASKSADELLSGWYSESKSMANGVEVESCTPCWIKEKQQLISKRTSIDNLDAGTTYISVFFDNICNLMCSYCSPKFSTKWEKTIKNKQFIPISDESKLHHKLDSRNIDSNDKLFNHNVVIELINKFPLNSVKLEILGGEPLIQNNISEFISQIDSNRIKKLIITTNLSFYNKRLLNQIIKHFGSNKVTIGVSLDLVPELNHIPRAGFNQQLFTQNLLKLINNNIQFFFRVTVSALSVLQLVDTIGWLKKQNFKFILNLVNSPACLSVQHMPAAFKQQCYNELLQITDTDVSPIIELLFAESNPTLEEEQKYYIKQYLHYSKAKVNEDANLQLKTFINYCIF